MLVKELGWDDLCENNDDTGATSCIPQKGNPSNYAKVLWLIAKNLKDR